jgi:diguanylate cyclase (GGDEF)-like protein/PAS domain S-box-containing protein
MPRLPALVLLLLFTAGASAETLTLTEEHATGHSVSLHPLWSDVMVYGLPAIIVLLAVAGILMRINRRLSSEISQRIALEQELRTSEYHYRGLIESLSAIAWEASPHDYRYSYVSPQAEDLLGYPLEKWGHSGFWRSVLHPLDALWVPAYCDVETAAGRDHSVDYRIIAADGRSVWIRDSVSLIEQGSSTVLRGLMIDISETKLTEEALRLSEEKFAKAFHASPDGLLLAREADGMLLEVNEGFSRLSGYPLQALTAQSSLDLGIWVDLNDRARLIDRLHREGSVEEFSCLVRRADGEIRLCELAASSLLFGGDACMLLMARDITERHLMQEKLLLAATVFESTAEGVLITDTRQRITAVNRAFSQITGYSEAEALGQTPRLLASGRHDHGFFIDMWHRLAADGHWQGEICNRRKSGEVYPSWLTISSVRNADDVISHFVAVFADISSLKQAEARLDYQAHHDPLTGLPNRTLFESRLQASLNSHGDEGGRGAVLFLDLDRFKHINDSLGHPVGDLLLQGIATRLREQVRAIDTVARLGGDEFIILLPGLQTSQDTVVIANKLLACFAAPFQAGEHEFFTSASIGASLYPQDGADVATLVKNADAAMYRSKAKGRNRVESYTRDLTTQASARVALEHELRRAIERNEISLAYQPKFCLKTHSLVGAEALIRWTHPTFGAVPPERFIALAEENGMILPLGEWVLEHACRQMRLWQDQYLSFGPLSVNLAGAQLRQPDLFARIHRLLEDHRLKPGCLQLEITENFIMSQAEEALLVLHQLKSLGVQLAIDDFGTGYSSLSYLKRLPLHTLKIDQSFVRGLPDDPHDAAIVRAIIALGRSMQLSVIAEGVENHAQQQFLANEGCEQIQGYIISLPLGAQDFASTFLRERVSDFSDGAIRKPSL